MKVSLYISIIALSLVTFNLSGQIQILIEPTQLGDSINSKSEEANPLLSPDGNTLFFVRTFADNNVGGKLAGQDIWYSERKNDNSWTFAKNLSELNNESNNVVIGFSQHDSLIYLLNTYSSPLRWNYGVAYSTLVNDVWANPKELNLKFNIRNAYRNYYMSTTEDVLLISTDSKDSYGNEDIYIYYKKGEKWHGPVHLNQNINSEASEISPFLSSDKEVLFFASDGHEGYGDMDIFMARRLDSTWTNWSQPVNLGEQINTTKFDAYFSTYAEGESFFVSNIDGYSNIYYTVLNYDFDDGSLEELRYLMTLEFSVPADENETVTVEEIASNAFSFNSEVAYYFDVFRLDDSGAVKDSVRVELSPNVQYNFNRYDDGIDYSEMAARLNSEGGPSAGEVSTEMVLLSKRLNLQTGETYVFNLKPVASHPEGAAVIMTEEKDYHLNVKEPKRIIFKMDDLEEMSVQTDMAYLQSQPQPVAGNFEADTDDFFEDDGSLEELRYLMTLEFSVPADENEAVEVEEITANSFSFNSEVAYYFDVFRLDDSGAVKDSVRVELSPNVQYNFNRYDDGIDYSEMAARLNSEGGPSAGEVSTEMVLLSKRLNLQTGETYVFNLKPVASHPEGAAVIMTEEKDYHLNVKEPKRIIFKMDDLEEMSVQTDMAYLQSQPQPVAGNFEADTDDFFSEEDNEVIEDERIKYRVQIAASRQELSKEELRRIYTGNKEIKMHTEDGWYKYYIADEDLYSKALHVLFTSEVKGVFIAAYTPEGEKVDLRKAIASDNNEKQIVNDSIVAPEADVVAENDDIEAIEVEGINYRVQIAGSKRKLSEEKLKEIYTGDREIKMQKEDGLYKYYIADDPSYFEARQILNDSNVNGAFIVAYTQDSEKVDLQDAFTYHYQKRKIERDNFVSQDSVESEVKVHFEFDKYVLEPDVCAYLDQKVVTSLQQNKNLIAVVNGHTDIRGSNTYNYILSEARATYVKDYILRKGIEEPRVRLKFFGETRTIEKCHEISDCEEHIHDANRRVEILLIQLEKNYISSD